MKLSSGAVLILNIKLFIFNTLPFKCLKSARLFCIKLVKSYIKHFYKYTKKVFKMIFYFILFHDDLLFIIIDKHFLSTKLAY